ncbi:MAG TPA: hypothetical protein VGF41_13365, partial [Myxococcaceae bacterium]
MADGAGAAAFTVEAVAGTTCAPPFQGAATDGAPTGCPPPFHGATAEGAGAAAFTGETAPGAAGPTPFHETAAEGAVASGFTGACAPPFHPATDGTPGAAFTASMFLVTGCAPPRTGA